MGRTVAATIKLIDQFSNPSKEVKKSANDLQKKFGNVGSAITNVGNIAGGAGTMLLKGITAPIIGVGTASIAAFNEVDEGLDTIIKKTGATGKAVEDFEDVFKEVATNVPADLADVGAAIGEINTRLGLTGKPLQEASEKFLKFAELNGTDVETAIATVTRSMGDAGIEAAKYGDVLDQLNVAGQVSGISIDQLATNLTKYGAPMRALGIDTKTAIAMFAGWEKSGVNTEIAFSGMKKAISNWSKDGKDATKEFSKSMDSIKKAKDISEATGIAIEVFGAKAGPDLADAIRGGRFEVDEYIKALDKSAGSVESTFAGTEDGVDKFKTASNAAKIALSELGGVLSDAVGPILEKITDKIKEVSKWFGSLDDSTKQNILTFGLIAAAIAPALLMFSKIATGVGGAITTFGKLAASVKKAGGILAVLTSPAGIVIGVLAGIAVAAVLVYKNFDKIKAFAAKMGQKIKEIAEKCGFSFDEMKEKFSVISDKVGIIVDKVGKKFAEIREKLQPVIDFLKMVFSEVIASVFESAERTITNTIQSIGKIFDGFITVLDGIIMILDGDFKGGFSNIFNGIKDIISGAMSAVVGIVKTPLNAVISLVNKAIDGINSINVKIPDDVPLVGGKQIGFNIAKIPMLYKGTDNWRGGTAIINEQQYGGEIVDLPKGTRVYPHDKSVRMAREDGTKHNSITISKLADQIIVREEADIDKVAAAITNKLKKVVFNMA